MCRVNHLGTSSSTNLEAVEIGLLHCARRLSWN
jgi:hypothetical protein